MVFFSISKRVFDVGICNDLSFTPAAWKSDNKELSFLHLYPPSRCIISLKVDIVLHFLFNNVMQSNDYSPKNDFKFSESYDKDFEANSKVTIWEFNIIYVKAR